ncbi:hypothetical protein SAMN05216554_3218 [Herbiconiux ginsengi]|uniref:Uncharacterized protein n=2 Tax=Herbiconiux ginsengi TaxID=381665 RepID=A0A1H3S0H0_9MICO|nr:hypothetical protein SAMN05216554_3218 [Herbiconiux ginsengi]
MGRLTDDQIADALRDLLLSGGARAGRKRTPTAVDLDQVLVDHVADRLDHVAPDRDRELDRSAAWALLIGAVTNGAPESAHDAKLLIAASHMLEVGTDPRDATKPAPYDDTRALMKSISVNSVTLKKQGGVSSDSVTYGTSIAFRRYYAAVVSKLGENAQTLRPDKHIESDNFGDAVGRAFRRLSRNDVALVNLMEAHTSASPLEDAPSSSRRRKSLLWAGVAVAAVAVVTAGILLANGITGAARGAAEASASLATVESVASEPPKWTMNTAFWVPATAPLEELEETTDGCFDPRARAWLQKYGVYRDVFLFTVRNVSGGTVGLSEVASRGTVSPAQPGLIVKCSGGGEGGDIDWSVLVLELGEDAVATLRDSTRVSDYFWRDMTDGETVGVMIHPTGEEDFTGTLTVDVLPTEGEASRLTIPAVEGANVREIEWHAMPSDKSVVFTLPSSDDASRCKVNGSELPTCTTASLRAALDDLWGKE